MLYFETRPRLVFGYGDGFTMIRAQPGEAGSKAPFST
jgi:hypothetical protein